MNINLKDQKVQIEYPCQWIYKVIGADPQQLHEAINVIIQQECSITLSNTSSSGKYHCYNVEVLVVDEQSRNLMYQQLKEHSAVKMVL